MAKVKKARRKRQTYGPNFYLIPFISCCPEVVEETWTRWEGIG
jgi:hypothetical protein